MKRPVLRATALALLHVALVSTLAAKYVYDRYTRPRVWVKTQNSDPDLPVRGRYLALSLDIAAPGVFKDPPLQPETKSDTEAFAYPARPDTPGPHYRPVYLHGRVNLQLHDGKLIAVKNERGEFYATYSRERDGTVSITINEQVDFYLPEHALGPGPLPKGDELWAEVTVPKKGPPRPIQLGVHHPDGTITPLQVR